MLPAEIPCVCQALLLPGCLSLAIQRRERRGGEREMLASCSYSSSFPWWLAAQGSAVSLARCCCSVLRSPGAEPGLLCPRCRSGCAAAPAPRPREDVSVRATASARLRTHRSQTALPIWGSYRACFLSVQNRLGGPRFLPPPSFFI